MLEREKGHVGDKGKGIVGRDGRGGVFGKKRVLEDIINVDSRPTKESCSVTPLGIMSCIFWNCRSLSQPRAVHAL